MNTYRTKLVIKELGTILVNGNGISRNEFQLVVEEEYQACSTTKVVLALEDTKCPAHSKEWAEVVSLARHWLRHKVKPHDPLLNSWTYSSSLWMVIIQVEKVDNQWNNQQINSLPPTSTKLSTMTTSHRLKTLFARIWRMVGN